MAEGALLGLVLEQGGGHKIILPSLAVFSPETVRERAPGPQPPQTPADASGRPRTVRGRSDTVRVVVGNIARWLRDEEAVVLPNLAVAVLGGAAAWHRRLGFICVDLWPLPRIDLCACEYQVGIGRS